MQNAVVEKITNGQKAVGTFLELGSSVVAECLGQTGLDFCIIDCEHGPFSPLSATELIVACEANGLTPFARTPDSSRASILRLLDAGAKGLIIPNVRSVEEVQRIVEYGKFSPLGKRGVASNRAGRFGFAEHASQGLAHYFRVCNEQTLLIPQCETKECLEHIDEIVALPGIDGIFVGPFDLSSDLGYPGDFEHPVVVSAIEKVLQACKQAGKFSFIYTCGAEPSTSALLQGFDAVTCLLDASVLVEAYRTLLKQIKR